MILYTIAILCALAAGGLGMDFSPSFTAMFAFAFLCLAALGDVCLRFRQKRPLLFLGRLLHIASDLCLFPATLIYAAQDDWFLYCIRVALIAGAVCHIGMWLLLYRRQGRKLGFGAGVDNWLMMTAGILTLCCAIPSPGLWPFAVGILLVLTGRRIGDRRKSGLARALGMLLCAVFLAAPMVF